LQESYGTTALDYLAGRSPKMRVFTAAEKQIRQEIADVGNHIVKLVRQRKSLPVHIQLAQTSKGAETVKLSTECKHLTNVLKMVAYQIESELVEQICPHYARMEDEGRTLIQTALQSSAAIAPTGKKLHITIAGLSSPHRSLAIAALCETLNRTNTPFPGTSLVMRFSVENHVSAAKSGQVS
jgi:hypothetical protein